METEQLERTNIDSETLQLSPGNVVSLESIQDKNPVDNRRDFVSDGPAYIPLPGAKEHSDEKSNVRAPKTEFVSDGLANIPLPELPDLDEEVVDIPQLPDIDSLFDESIKETPSLPNLDDLF